MKSSSVLNAIPKCYAKENASQISLWDNQSDDETWPVSMGINDHVIRTLRFPCADGSTDPEWTQRVYRQMNGTQHECIDMLFAGRCTALLYVDVLECWIAADGVVTARCEMYLGGPDIERLRTGMSIENEEDSDVD